MRKLLYILRGVIVITLLAITSAVAILSIYILFLIHHLIFFKKGRDFVYEKLQQVTFCWSYFNGWIYRTFLPTKWKIEGVPELDQKKWYLILSNHQSGTDIMVLFYLLNRKTSSVKFFLKRELLWQLPFVGFACWLLGFPFLIRHSKKYIRKHPESKWKDIETTKKACEKFQLYPCSIINFVEGTRYTLAKHDRQNSKYHYLLKPKAAGIALVLEKMQHHLASVLDATIVYSHEKKGFWKFVSGQIKEITLSLKTKPITEEIIGDYYKDRDFRKCIQHWLNEVWLEKDQKIADLKEENKNVE